MIMAAARGSTGPLNLRSCQQCSGSKAHARKRVAALTWTGDRPRQAGRPLSGARALLQTIRRDTGVSECMPMHVCGRWLTECIPPRLPFAVAAACGAARAEGRLPALPAQGLAQRSPAAARPLAAAPQFPARAQTSLPETMACPPPLPALLVIGCLFWRRAPTQGWQRGQGAQGQPGRLAPGQWSSTPAMTRQGHALSRGTLRPLMGPKAESLVLGQLWTQQPSPPAAKSAVLASCRLTRQAATARVRQGAAGERRMVVQLRMGGEGEQKGPFVQGKESLITSPTQACCPKSTLDVASRPAPGASLRFTLLINKLRVRTGCALGSCSSCCGLCTALLLAGPGRCCKGQLGSRWVCTADWSHNP